MSGRQRSDTLSRIQRVERSQLSYRAAQQRYARGFGGATGGRLPGCESFRLRPLENLRRIEQPGGAKLPRRTHTRRFPCRLHQRGKQLSAHLKHLHPPGFKWRRLFEVWLPFTAKLTVFFPNDGRLHILNAASPVSARETRVFSPICRDFDKDAPLQDTMDFNHQVFAEDKAIVEKQFPEDLPISLQEEVHIRADRSSITYRQCLAKLGLGRAFTA